MKRKRHIEPEAPQAGAQRAAPGVQYFELAGAEGLSFFRCDTYSANLSTKGCSTRWLQAQTATGEAGERFATCRACPIGAAHAGHNPVAYSKLYASMICPRCGKGCMRMIGGTRCVSCYNREREVAIGRNARGNVPTVLLRDKAYRTVHLSVIVDGKPSRATVDGAVLTLEPILQAMRTIKGDLAFAFAGPPRVSMGHGGL